MFSASLAVDVQKRTDRPRAATNPLKINTAGCFLLVGNLSTSNPNMYSLSEASTLQRTEQNFVLSSSRLPQHDRLYIFLGMIVSNYIQHSSVSLPILINEKNTIKDKRRMRANVTMNLSLITGKKI